MPDTTRDSVATLISIMVCIILIGAVTTGHLPFQTTDSAGGKVVSEAQANTMAQNNIVKASMVLESEGSLPAGLSTQEPTSIPVTITNPLPTKAPVPNFESKDSLYSPEQEQIIAFIRQTFGKDADNAIAIAKCESGLRPKAFNDNTTWGGVGQDYGLFQVNSTYQLVSNLNFLYDYRINTLMAKKIFDGRGNWSAWTCSRKLGL